MKRQHKPRYAGALIGQHSCSTTSNIPSRRKQTNLLFGTPSRHSATAVSSTAGTAATGLSVLAGISITQLQRHGYEMILNNLEGVAFLQEGQHCKASDVIFSDQNQG